MSKPIYIVIFLLLSVSILSCKDSNETGSSLSTEAKSSINKMDPEEVLQKRIEETKHLQEQRKDFLNDMIEGGLATRIENPNGQPYIYVTQPFYQLSKSEQASMMNVLWYYFITEDRNVDVLAIYDNDTGNEVGTFGRNGLIIAE